MAGWEGAVVTESDEAPSLEMVAAALRVDSTDVALYARVLTESLVETLPPECVTVERQRSVADRMRGRLGEVSTVVIRLGDLVLTLAVRHGQPVAEVRKEVRGVVLSRQQIPLQEWTAMLAKALVEQAERNAGAARALRKLVTGS